MISGLRKHGFCRWAINQNEVFRLKVIRNGARKYLGVGLERTYKDIRKIKSRWNVEERTSTMGDNLSNDFFRIELCR